MSNPLISLSGCPRKQLAYEEIQRQNENDVAFWLEIKTEVLAEWRRYQVGCGNEILYTDLLNAIIPGDAFKLNRETRRLEMRLSRICIEAETKRKKLNRKGSVRKRKEFSEANTKIAVLKTDIITVEEWEKQIKDLELELEKASNEVEEWKGKYVNIEKEKECLFQEIDSYLKESETWSNVKNENELMRKYIRQLERDEVNKVRGKSIPDLKTPQGQNRKLKEMKTRAQKALYFVELFGLELDCLKLRSKGGPKTYTINFATDSPPQTPTPQTPTPQTPTPQTPTPQTPTPQTPTPQTPTGHDHTPSNSTSSNTEVITPSDQETPPADNGTLENNTPEAPTKPRRHYSTLSENDKATVESILFLLDKFGVGDEFIHKLSMVVDGLPKSYLFKQCRQQLNGSCKITSTPGKYPGAQHSFQELLADQILELKNSNILKNDQKVSVKISGDGARMSRSSNFILISFAILESKDDLLSSKGTHTIAVVNGSESRGTLENSFRDVFNEINLVKENGYIMVDGSKVEVDFFLGGDYKFLLLVMGLSAANSIYACIWCKVHKNERGDMTKPDDYYDSGTMQRTLDELKKMAETGDFCCTSKPLLSIALNKIIPDELHLMLRVSDILIGNLIEDALQWDEKDQFRNRGKNLGTHLKKLVETICSCGVSFSVWEKNNADGRGSGTMDWTSLMGDDRKKLLNELPQKLGEAIQPDTAQAVADLWKKFADMYFGFISSLKPYNIDQYRARIKQWIDDFTSLGHKRVGYKTERVTCYMHMAAYHIPNMVKMHDNLKQFSGQGVEKNNDDARKIIQRKTNHTDDPAEILRAEYRMRVLKQRERKPNPYTKRNLQFWETTIRINRKSKKYVSHDKPVEEDPPLAEIQNLIQDNCCPKRKRKRATIKRNKNKKSK